MFDTTVGAIYIYTYIRKEEDNHYSDRENTLSLHVLFSRSVLLNVYSHALHHVTYRLC